MTQLIEYSLVSASLYPVSATGTAKLETKTNFPFTFIPQQATTAGSYRVRITDVLLTRRVALSPTFIFDPNQANSILDFVWDYSTRLGTTAVPLHGIAADSVARFYIKATPPTGTAKAIASLEDVGGTSTLPRILGKLKNAANISSFSTEANDANSITATQTQLQQGAFWFWYVAPEDFSRGTIDNTSGEREVMLRLKYYNASNVLLFETTKPIKIVRPPLMLVHGLGGNKTTWRNFKHDGILFQFDAAFKVINVLDMYGTQSFNSNSRVLLALDENKKEYSFLSTLQSLREQGYACNRVDYVAHSMGGSMLRNTLHNILLKGLYYLLPANYGKGYVHKFITLDTPHQGSPLGDVVTEFAPYMNTLEFQKDALEKIASDDLRAFYEYSSNNVPNYKTHTTPDGQTFSVPYYTINVKATDAVRDLSYRNGVRFNAASINNHQIIGDYVRKYSFPEDAFIKSDIGEDYKSSLGFSVIGEFLSDGALKKFKNCNCIKIENELKNLRFLYLNPLQQVTSSGVLGATFAIEFINWQSKRVYPNGVAPFFSNSDMVVSVESQAAGKIRTGTQTGNALTILDVNHNLAPDKATFSEAAGNRVFTLLNTSIHSSFFDRVIPASSTITSPYDCSNPANCTPPPLGTPVVAASSLTAPTIEITYPQMGDTIQSSTALNISVIISDTTHLQGINTKFQRYSLVDNSKKNPSTYKVQVWNEHLGWQGLISTATYKVNDSTFTTYSDTVWVYVQTSIPIVSIGANQNIYDMVVGEKLPIDVTIYHESFNRILLSVEDNLNISVQDPTIVKYDSKSGQFIGLKVGVTKAIVNYKGKTTEMLFNVSPTESCPPTLTHSTGLLAAGTYQADQTIISLANVSSPTTFKAGQSILLTDGFQAGPNEMFVATIEGCNTNTIPTNGLVAYYPFNGNANDESGNNYHGAIDGAILATDRNGTANRAFSFNGTNGRIRVEDTPNLNFTSSFSISFWAKINAWGNSNNTAPGIISKKSSDQNVGYVIYNDGFYLNKINFRLKGSSSQDYMPSNTSVTIGSWECWTMVYNSTDGTNKLFRNGILDKSYSTGNLGNMSSTAPLYFGYSQTWNGYLNGSLDEIRIYNRAITNDEVLQIYNAEKP